MGTRPAYKSCTGGRPAPYLHLFGYCLQQASSSITNGSILGDMPLGRLSGHPHNPIDAQHILQHKDLAVDAIYARYAYSDEKTVAISEWRGFSRGCCAGSLVTRIGRCREWFASVSTLGGYLWDARLHGLHLLERVKEL